MVPFNRFTFLCPTCAVFFSLIARAKGNPRKENYKGVNIQNFWEEVDRGAQSRNRTSDTGIFSPLLYQLSYLGMRLHIKPLTYKKSGGICLDKNGKMATIRKNSLTTSRLEPSEGKRPGPAESSGQSTILHTVLRGTRALIQVLFPSPQGLSP